MRTFSCVPHPSPAQWRTPPSARMPLLWAAHHGLHVYRVGGPKVTRDNLMCVLAKLRVDGKAISVNKREGIVQIGERSYPIKKGGPRD